MLSSKVGIIEATAFEAWFSSAIDVTSLVVEVWLIEKIALKAWFLSAIDVPCPSKKEEKFLF